MKTTSILAGVAVLLLAVGAGVLLQRGRGGADADGAAAAASGASAASGAAFAASAGGGPVSVGSVRAERRDMPVVIEANGTVTSLNSVDVKPQVASVIRQVHIREGQSVRSGEPLFTLDARADEANVLKAQAQLQKDLASLADAQRQLARSKELLAQGFVSQGAVDSTLAQVEAQQAAVAADRAAIESARVNVSYSRIVAPTSGRAGAIPVVAGSFVQPGGAALVTITQLDPIAVGFSLPQRHLADALAALRNGGGLVTAVLPENRGERAGRLQFVDNAIDAATGTLRAKAVFGNTDQALWPGAFVTVRLAVRMLKDAIVVPLASVVQGQRGRIVFVIDKDGKAAVRPVELVYATGNDAAVTGLNGGERVILDGRQNVRPGTSVVERSGDPTRARRAGGAASSAASGAP
jgi:RND family efflux transporter MFP subunit